jgi:hypothetical protein
MPFDPSDDDGWWPNPWAPLSGPGGAYPYNWTDPFINSRAAIPNPVASAPAPFSAAALGAMAWHPPIFLNGPSATAPGDFSASTWPQQPFLPGGSTTAPVWPPQSFLAPIAQLGLPGVPSSIGRPLGPFTPDLGLARGGLFGSDPGLDPTSPFAGLPFEPRVPAAASPANPGPPRAPYTLGMPPRLPPLTQFQSPVETSAPALDLSSSPEVDVPGAPTAVPTRSVLFNQPPAPRDLGARERDLADLDEAAWNASPSGSLRVADIQIRPADVPAAAGTLHLVRASPLRRTPAESESRRLLHQGDSATSAVSCNARQDSESEQSVRRTGAPRSCDLASAVDTRRWSN